VKRYQKKPIEANRKKAVEAVAEVVRPSLEDHIRQVFRERLPQLLDEELQEYLGRGRYERREANEPVKQYRNGKGKTRTISCGVGDLSVRVPRLREPWESQIVRRYERMSETSRKLLPELYLHGLATGDFGQCLHAMLGEEAPLSDSTIVRLKRQWQQEYEEWKNRKLLAEYLFVWVDGVYPKAGPKDEALALLVVVGVNRKGVKELLAIEEGYRESTESWKDLLRSLKRRGVGWIGMAVADGAIGFEKALMQIFPKTRFQRCWVHKMRNVLDKIPLHAHEEVHEKLRAMYMARDRDEALKLRTEFVRLYQERYPKAVASLLEAGEQLFTYFDFPKVFWRSIKTTNVIESAFASVKLRTDAARRIRRRDSATYLVFKLLVTAEQRWFRLRGHKAVVQTIDALKSTTRTPRLQKAA
jgi:putative transposase